MNRIFCIIVCGIVLAITCAVSGCRSSSMESFSTAPEYPEIERWWR